MGSPARRDARLLFLRAVAPTVASAVVSGALLLPSFLMHEAPRADERPGVILIVLAAAGAVRLAWIGARAFRAVEASRTLVRTWRAGAIALPREPWGIRASRIDAGFPMVAVAGLFKPHVFVDGSVMDACSAAELAAVAAHERAHVASRDNLRRLLVTACAGHDSDAAVAWRIAAERSADERAADSPRAAADLAGALVRVARMAPSPMLPAAAISTIHDGGSLESRVRRLLELTPSAHTRTPQAWLGVGGAAVLAAGLMLASPMPKVLHAMLEVLVQRLP